MANENGQPVTAGEEPGSAAPARRADDAAIMLFGADPGGSGMVGDIGNFQPSPERLANAAFVIDLGAGDALVVPAADAHLLPRGEGGEELKARAAVLTEALRRDRDWVRRRLQMPDFLLHYADRLQQATTEADIYEALRETATPVVGAHTTIVYVGVPGGGDPQFHPLAEAALRLALEPVPMETVSQFRAQRLLMDADVAAQPQGPLAPLAQVFAATAATQLLCAPVARDALVVLVERRRQRVLTGEDRDLLQALIRQAEAALRRVTSERQAAALARFVN